MIPAAVARDTVMYMIIHLLYIDACNAGREKQAVGQLVSAKLVGSGLMLKEMRQRHAHSVLKVSMDSPKEGSRKKVRVKIALQVDLLKHMDRQQHVLGVLPVLIAKIKAWIASNNIGRRNFRLTPFRRESVACNFYNFLLHLKSNHW